MENRAQVLLIQPRCGKYDLFIRDMPLGLLYAARLLAGEGIPVTILDQRVLQEDFFPRLSEELRKGPLWVGVTAMTGEPVKHALESCRFVRERSDAPLVWGGIHPTILPEQTLVSPLVDYVVRGKGERTSLFLTRYFMGQGELSGVPGLSYAEESGRVVHQPEDDERQWEAMPRVPYHLVNLSDYQRVGFSEKVFSIMTSRNCPHRCAFCYNSSLKRKKPWLPDSLEETRRHIDFILETFEPDYLSFIDDDFFINRKRARKILEHLDGRAPAMKVGFRGARVSDLVKMDEDFFDLMERVNTRHINIGVESGSERILRIIKKGITVEETLALNRRLAGRKDFVPLYNFFSGIPQETEEDIKASTELILRLVAENPRCQISGYHQYTPYPGNELFAEAVRSGFSEPQTLEAWGDLRFEDNAANCPWIDRDRRRLLDMVYSMIYFVDNKYESYIAGHNPVLKALVPLVKLYRPLARARMARHITAFPVEMWAKNLIYKVLYRA